MPLNNVYFSTNLKGLENSVTRYFFDVGTWFCIVLNVYNKKKKATDACPNIFFFSLSNEKMALFP
ncbi:hypothetical protein TSAR_009887 [Trichomalopsis sarcophagae]|uniref:Uncharacterized protein n=1 Tax=Trichomalopsis sarcophagae TaxID=543379 RepID=A0A232F8H5_9HYME|nr:hypothetical protein TSAR_009887 [Trichomalopsis sarcophagae]